MPELNLGDSIIKIASVVRDSCLTYKFACFTFPGSSRQPTARFCQISPAQTTRTDSPSRPYC